MDQVFALHNQIVPQTCGVGVLGMFREEAPHGYQTLATEQHKGGCDWLMASFTSERPAYKKAYEALLARYGEPVYQSPKRRNRRTGRMFFFCIWDTKGKA